jgi:SAM-dependent methyltransferase
MEAFFIERPLCPACKGQNTDSIYEKPYHMAPMRDYVENSFPGLFSLEEFKQLPFRVNECRNCKLVYQAVIPSLSALQRIYSGSQAAVTSDLSRKIDFTEELLRFISFSGKAPEELSVLDYGMGDSLWARLALSYGCKAYGYDLCETSCERARKRGVEVLNEEQIASQAFDLINFDQVLEHLSNPLEVMNMLASALKPSGILKVSVPNGRWIKKALKHEDWSCSRGKYSLDPLGPMLHLNCFNTLSLKGIAKQVGLDCLDLPILTQYKYSLRWTEPRWFVRNLITPLKRRFLNRGTYCLFTKSA